MRIAGAGANRYTFDAVIYADFAASSRRGVMLSMLHRARPKVASTRVFCSIARSRQEAAGRFSSSDCQASPPLKETKTPLSRAAKTRLRFSESSRSAWAALLGSPVLDSFQFLP